MQTLRKCLHIDRDMADAHFALAVTLSELHRKKEALKHFERAESFYPDDSTWQPKAAEMIEKLGREAQVSPILFKEGLLVIYSYGLFYGLGIVAAMAYSKASSAAR